MAAAQSIAPTLLMLPMPDDDLAPDIRRFQQTLAARYAEHPPLAGVDLATARAIVEAVREPFVQGGPAMRSSDDHEVVDGARGLRVAVRVHRPDVPRGGPALVYLHGGGWVYFSLRTHDRLMRELAARAGRVVIGVDYTRSPEVRFPVALEQTLAAWRWARDGADALGIDAARIALAGDSVGANLALSAALDLRADAVGPDALLLLYGAYTDAEDESYDRYESAAYTLDRTEMRGFWQAYVRSDADRLDPRAMPLKAPSFAGLPRTAVVVGECDVLRDGSLELARAFERDGVATALQHYPGATHSFLEAVSFSPLADTALARAAAWLRGAPA